MKLPVWCRVDWHSDTQLNPSGVLFISLSGISGHFLGDLSAKIAIKNMTEWRFWIVIISLTLHLNININKLNPYWQILENSSRNFSEISVFRGVTQTDFWKTHPVFFRNFNFRGVSRIDFWKIHPSIFCEYLFSFCIISARVMPQNSKIDCWISFPEIG